MDASPGQFADHLPDRAQLMTRDNALAETTIGLYKNECITADYIAWYNQQRLMHRLGRVPPAEAEAGYHSQLVTDRPAGSQNPEGA